MTKAFHSPNPKRSGRIRHSTKAENLFDVFVLDTQNLRTFYYTNNRHLRFFGLGCFLHPQ
jgi:hypothetical protein